jgi:hypothetical protein
MQSFTLNREGVDEYSKDHMEMAKCVVDQAPSLASKRKHEAKVGMRFDVGMETFSCKARSIGLSVAISGSCRMFSLSQSLTLGTCTAMLKSRYRTEEHYHAALDWSGAIGGVGESNGEKVGARMCFFFIPASARCCSNFEGKRSDCDPHIVTRPSRCFHIMPV